MKIGIFGDSFADEQNIFRPDNLSWANQIRESGYDVDNYGKCASSLYYSYLQLKEHHEKYDKIIFTITGDGRLFLEHLPETMQHISHGRIENLKNETNGEYLHVIKAIEYYYAHLHNYSYAKTTHRLLLKECMAIRPDALFIPCFVESLDGGEDFNLNMISDYDRNQIDSGCVIVEDRRFCHMNDNNNSLVAGKIKDWINSGEFKINQSELIKTTLPITEILGLQTPGV
jgi:hypothetical protein